MTSNSDAQLDSRMSDDDYTFSLPPVRLTKDSSNVATQVPSAQVQMVRETPFQDLSYQTNDIESQQYTPVVLPPAVVPPVVVPSPPTQNKSHFKRFKPLYMSLLLLLVVAAVVVPVTVIQLRDKDDDKQEQLPEQEIVIPDNFTTIGFSFGDSWMNDSNWNYTKVVYGNDTIRVIDNNTLAVKYPQGSYSPSSEIDGGFSFYMSPKNMELTDEVYLSYRVKFGDENGFDWVKGGMLPGIWIGRMGAFGGVFLEDGASMRVMWRSGGSAEAYVYVPPFQASDYYNLPGYVKNEGFGDSLGRGILQFNAGEWNDVVMHVKLNSPGQYDGILELNVNGLLLKYEKMNWRNGSEPISGIMMQSFFGGADVTWATPLDQEITFSDFKISV